MIDVKLCHINFIHYTFAALFNILIAMFKQSQLCNISGHHASEPMTMGTPTSPTSPGHTSQYLPSYLLGDSMSHAVSVSFIFYNKRHPDLDKSTPPLAFVSESSGQRAKNNQ
jgi:hypothetical protein